MINNIWPSPAGSGQAQIYDFCQRVGNLLRQERYKDYHVASITLSAGTSTAVTWSGMSGDHRVSITPTNAAAAGIVPYVSARTPGTGFTLTHGTAAGTETYDVVAIR